MNVQPFLHRLRNEIYFIVKLHAKYAEVDEELKDFSF